jgi:galactose oxidase
LPPGAVVTFKTKDSTQCIGVNHASKDNEARLGRFNCDNHPNQRWLVIRQRNEYRFMNEQSKKCIGVDFASTKVGADIIPFKCDGSRNQAWTLPGEPNPVVKISNAKSRICLGVDSAVRLAEQLDCNRGSGEVKEWRVVLRRRDAGPD